MNHLESQLDYILADRLPEPGGYIDVAPGIRWVRMALPFALNHVNLWLLRDNQPDAADSQVWRTGWTIVDCGIDNPVTRANWMQLFENALDGLPVLRVIATHCHPDHIGLAHWLCEHWQVRLWTSAGEYLAARAMSAGLPGAEGAAMLPHFLRHGLDDAAANRIGERKTYYPSLVPDVPHQFRRLKQGETLEINRQEWRVITGYGHSPEHIALYRETDKTLIAGDMVLPRISTNVSVFPLEPEANPVQQFMDSLQSYLPLPADTLTLPSHGKPFRGLHVRIGQLLSHHHDRLAEVFAFCTEPRTAMEIVPLMFKRPLDGHQMTFALGEALAHLNQLWLAGKLCRTLDDGDVYRFVHAEQR